MLTLGHHYFKYRLNISKMLTFNEKVDCYVLHTDNMSHNAIKRYVKRNHRLIFAIYDSEISKYRIFKYMNINRFSGTLLYHAWFKETKVTEKLPRNTVLLQNPDPYPLLHYKCA